MTLQAEEKESLFLGRRETFPSRLLALSLLALVPTSSQIPFGRRRSDRPPPLPPLPLPPIYTAARRKALEENSTRGVSASVPYFARQQRRRRRSDSAKGLRGFTSITEIQRDTYNGALFDAKEIDAAIVLRKSVGFSGAKGGRRAPLAIFRVSRLNSEIHLHNFNRFSLIIYYGVCTAVIL